ncbi:alkaline shock response membrane anchor protein AmaP [Streptomyces sp. A1499]|uniref:alkaline shock response membrane anchor protein AmaP n=1 Tax=Streptomyces sp. A1499 TaxID=2563104 RepID=UPI0019D09036|nr:alkaline shock response membrane anchor protein AmaP [Streptomyces sp. A1499]
MSRLRNATRRGVLFVLAAALVGAGAALASATEPVRGRLPAGWPRLPADRVWLDGDALGRWRDRGWWTPLVIAALCLGVLLFLWWAAGRLRAGRLRELALGRADVTLSGAALASAVAERARAVRGVADARVVLLGRSARLRVRVTVTLASDGVPGAVLGALAREALAEVRGVAAPRGVEAEVRFASSRSRRGWLSGRGRVR